MSILSRWVCFALPCYEMPVHNGFFHCGVVCVLATFTIAAGSILYCHNMWFPIFPGPAFFLFFTLRQALSWNCHAIVLMLWLSVVLCLWYAQCYTCLFLGACMLSHALCTFVCILIKRGAYHSCFTHAIPTCDSWGCDRHRGIVLCARRASWLVGQPGVDINHLRPIYVQLVQNNPPPSPPRIPLSAF